MAALGAVGGPVGDHVVACVIIIGATVYTKLGRQSDSATEEKEGIENVEGKRNGCGGHHAGESAGDKEEEREHGEDGDEHGVVDDGWVAGEGFGDDVTHDRHDEEGPEELEAAQT